MKYEYLYDFKKYGGGAYSVAKKMGWVEKYTWLAKKKRDAGFWNDKERCRAAAKECQNVKEFCHKYGRAWEYSSRNNWLDEFYPDHIDLKPNIFDS